MNEIEIRREIIEEAKRRFGIKISVGISQTDFGSSMYISFYPYSNIKIRISNHSVTNFDRIWNERHYSIENAINSMDFIMSDIEEIYFPERFETVENVRDKVIYSHDLFESTEAFKNKYNTAIIDRDVEFVTKKGVSKREIHYHYTVINGEKYKVKKRK